VADGIVNKLIVKPATEPTDADIAKAAVDTLTVQCHSALPGNRSFHSPISDPSSGGTGTGRA
jgi:hypothetical protein